MDSTMPSNGESVTLTQTGEIALADGAVLEPSKESITTDYMENAKLPVENFTQYTYTEEDGTKLMYSLYLPDDYDENTSYPFVLFIPDALAVGTDWETVLQCGNGGTVWASDDWQAGNPCFVVAMIYEDRYINDYNECDESWMEGMMNLIRNLAEKYRRIRTASTRPVPPWERWPRWS